MAVAALLVIIVDCYGLSYKERGFQVEGQLEYILPTEGKGR